MKKIAVVTGTRAEYGYLKHLMEKIKKESSLKLFPVVTGMHLLPIPGYTLHLSYLMITVAVPLLTIPRMA